MNYKNYINNNWLKSDSGKTFKAFNPYTEEVIAEIQASNETDVDNAVEAAVEAYKEWGVMTPGERRDFLRRLAANHWSMLSPLQKQFPKKWGNRLKRP